MPATLSPVLLNQATIASFTPVDLDSVEAAHFMQTLAPHSPPAPPHLVVDCSHLKCLRNLGVSYVVSQLLLLHQSGARVFLRNAEPLLQRCLQLLQLDSLFPVI